ncbi:TIGR02234 family membrane protein, partial [Streptomyces sp. NEAU-H3]|nr:TIGR02234 family membrane protein [Streptomyces sp. NEAU-H3]
AAPRPRAPRRALDPDRPEDLWKAIDRGEDPTGER